MHGVPKEVYTSKSLNVLLQNAMRIEHFETFILKLGVPTGEISKLYNFLATDLKFCTEISLRYIQYNCYGGNNY